MLRGPRASVGAEGPPRSSGPRPMQRSRCGRSVRGVDPCRWLAVDRVGRLTRTSVTGPCRRRAPQDPSLSAPDQREGRALL